MGKLHPNQILAYFVHHLKIMITLKKNKTKQKKHVHPKDDLKIRI